MIHIWIEKTWPAHQRMATLFAVALGLTGGALFAFFKAPLAWMLGAMTFCVIACTIGKKPVIPSAFRSIMIAVLGVMLGSAFRPALIQELPHWWGSLIVLYLTISTMAFFAFLAFRHIGKLDPTTAFFCASPGGLSEMVLLGDSFGADPRTISLAHAVRILIVVTLIPFYFRGIMGLEVPALPSNGTHLLALPLKDYLILGACAVIGPRLAKLLRLPAKELLGGMATSAIAHLTGLTSAAPPLEIIAVAQLVVGSAIGCRFAGINWRAAGRTALLAAGTSTLMVLFALVAATTAAPLVHRDMQGLFLAFAPGGLAEMALISLSLGIETAFVSSMHIMRIFAVIVTAPLLFERFKKFH